MTPMPRPVAVVVWLATCILCCTKAQPIPASEDGAIKIPRLGLYKRGVVNEEEAKTDADGALHMEQVFVHRFSNVLGNQTEKVKLEEALDFILGAAEKLRNTFNAAPSNAQLLSDSITGSETALRAMQLARDLSATVVAGGDELKANAVTETLNQIAAQVADLSPASCHPVTRRIVLASLVRLQMLLHEPLLSEEAKTLRDSSETATLLFRICRLLFNLHRQGASAKGAIEFLHISKSGGTSMCSVADKNGCTTESTSNFGNCMVRRFDDRPRWVSAAVHNLSAPLNGWKWFYRYAVRRGNRSCEYRDEFMQRNRYTFYSNEFAVHGGLENAEEQNGVEGGEEGVGANTGAAAAGGDGSSPAWRSAHLCPQFLNFVMLRQPLARLLSHVKWIIKVYRTEYGRHSEAFFRARDADYWRTFAPAAVDNYYIRLLLGEEVFYLPSGTINATHLEAAELVLLQYDIVVLLEADDIDELWLKMALGWRVGLSSAHARVAGSSRATEELVPYDMDELMAANAEDVRLYQFGAVLHQLDGLMFAAMAAANLQPFSPFAYINASEKNVGKRVRCGYVTRKQQLLGNVGLNISAFTRTYEQHFSRILSLDERVRPPAPPPRKRGRLRLLEWPQLQLQLQQGGVAVQEEGEEEQGGEEEEAEEQVECEGRQSPQQRQRQRQHEGHKDKER
ncbi:hypothetical protein VOLCADRAFT_98343 [Volvox carteri f. nagariensis]|uniref:Uncharacterized protein n=1 Tax=Volvox carteri f. nagariensis TaxID=3068 RepID=D8UF37_VOLCA|nr:uncharacterized protein VOLCADRAFT_98343 [Volvox carteri f. nagariensis]EFJ41612.1 hypothetical protein VOLCADRAFT_98343 [Volvox carteri f. nagariensis]|eukprot:XP_002957268.1 hypothetical protein VOLCADRAFT_98343 [Volvox carteri f. nagariensis]